MQKHLDSTGFEAPFSSTDVVTPTAANPLVNSANY
jgi:hypothetical protein